MINVHTLGPTGTNCEKAAHEYLRRESKAGKILLHETLEAAVEELINSDEGGVLLGCIVYPKLHDIVFKNLRTLKLVDCFVIDTHEMVFAGRDNSLAAISSVGTHPAPKHLVLEVPDLRRDVEVTICDSNSAASLKCANGDFDACITTDVAANANGLHIFKSFGPVPMGFSIHGKE